MNVRTTYPMSPLAVALVGALLTVALAGNSFAQPSRTSAHKPAPTPAAAAASQPAAPPAATAPRPASGQPIALADALAAARDNLDVSIARRALSAARADVLAADRAPFPVLSGKVSSIDLQNGVGAGNAITRKRIDKGVGVDWTWERGNKRELRTRAAQRGATAATADVDDVQLQQLLRAIGAYYDLVSAQERIEQLAEVELSSSLIATSAGRRVKAGDLGRQDALRTEIDAQRVRADQSAALLERQRASLVLAQLIGRMSNPEELRATSDWPPLSAAPALSDPAVSGQLVALVDSRPEVRAAMARIEAARAQVDLAESQKKADVTWGVSVDHYPGTSTRLVELRASIPLQFGYRYEGEIVRGVALQGQAEDALEKVRRETYADLLQLQ
ncbi:MAG: TolC family protein, partial [Burkholderiales bacterium]